MVGPADVAVAEGAFDGFLRGAEGRPAGGLAQSAIDLGTGLAIALPVYWLFTKLLAINLPGLTGTGWI